MKMNLICKTKRLEIRPFRSSDYSAWVEFWTLMEEPKNEWDISRRIPKNFNRKVFQEVLKTQKNLQDQDKYYNFAAFKKDGKIVGTLSLMDISRGVFHNAYLGYSVSNQYWGQGFGNEAVKAVLQLGFQKLGLHRIEAGISPHNKRSIALAKSLKMRKEGTKVRALFLDKKWQDILVYALTCEDLGIKFKGLKPTLQNARR